MKGVLCPACPGLRLTYHRGKWRCSKCAHVDSLAHLDALSQYRTLVKATITSSEFREFTGISSRSVASKMLANAKMPYLGSFKDRNYIIPEAFLRVDRISSSSDSI